MPEGAQGDHVRPLKTPSATGNRRPQIRLPALRVYAEEVIDLLPPLLHKGFVVLDLFHQAAEHDPKGPGHLLPEPADDLFRITAQGNQVGALV